MKKFIQICSLLSILVLFTVISVSANTGFGTEVEIPFAFTVGDRSYDAGSYIVRFERISSSTSSLTIQDTKNDGMQTVLLNMSSSSANGEMKLVFDTIEGKKYLTKVGLSNKTFAVIRPKVSNKANSGGAGTGGGADLF